MPRRSLKYRLMSMVVALAIVVAAAIALFKGSWRTSVVLGLLWFGVEASALYQERKARREGRLR